MDVSFGFSTFVYDKINVIPSPHALGRTELSGGFKRIRPVAGSNGVKRGLTRLGSNAKKETDRSGTGTMRLQQDQLGPPLFGGFDGFR
ncbi:hypothetical protein L2E82_00983 [Cichorium intybus]|uniref:Uncharacterized protein n=1 Tax=Cichorium intybus TaxID=13427 RepID=A0ACB9GYC4_CICIN|nr:hypothetical protein L2E82_00983 [Cichorium intybus]